MLRGLLCLLLAGLCAPSFAQQSTIVFRDATVIPMDSERTLPHTTVVVQGGKIVRVGDAGAVATPPGARVIDCRGKYLVPGLADMHMHVDRAEELPLFLLAGVTTTLNMGLASPEFVTATRMRVREGELPGPQIFVAFMIDGPGDPGPEFVPVSEDDARAAVDRAQLVGYDFIKVYSRLQPNICAAVLDEAKKKHIAVVGHIPNAVGLEQALASGQVMVAHSEEFYKTFFQNQPDDSRIPQAVALTKQAGAYVTPNLSFFSGLTERVAHPESIDAMLAGPEARLVPPDVRGSWLSGRGNRPSDRFVPELALLRRLTLGLSRAGVPLLAGTDTPAGGMIPGDSLDADLQQLVLAGLTPYEALSAATRTPGEFINRYAPGTERFGTIAEGERADLLLLEQNPLQDIDRVRHPAGVMAGGRWYTRAELVALAEKPVAGYEAVERLQERFRQAAQARGAEAAIRAYIHRAGGPLPTENFLNSLGYQLLAQKRLPDAIRVFRLNTELHPQSWNAYDSLGEAYADAGDKDSAVANYRRSLALNPRNAGAQRFLEQQLAK